MSKDQLKTKKRLFFIALGDCFGSVMTKVTDETAADEKYNTLMWKAYNTHWQIKK